ncbi:GerAB/ArcD/ProY family transporter [Brevibacillus dissolubilis]|uniref:GerAB/ArcD/ProY family transporter n=1 Tax=Brevibacillus dissolubilis TaxID=1844116 RepID=UPI001115EF61|nr:GerAB/ArcD/ProY family transporter [Brevibacillus dissolubilis]
MNQPRPQWMFSSFLVFFVVHTIQVGVGLPGFQRYVYEPAGNDAWISVILAGISSHISAFFMVKILQRYHSCDLYEIHEHLFGKWLGKAANALYTAYLAMACFIIVINYIDIIQTWLFPTFTSTSLSLILLAVAVYGVLGGIRVIAGFGFISIVLTAWMALLVYFAKPYIQWDQLFPIMDHKLTDILEGARVMSYTLAGFEIVFFIYPYVKEKEKTMRYTHLGLLATTLISLELMVVALLYFEGEQLMKTAWATFTMYKIIQFPFLERFEFLAVSLWMLIIMPNILLYMWASIRGFRRLTGRSQRMGIILVCILILGLSNVFTTRMRIDQLDSVFNQITFFIAFLYPILLYPLVLFKTRTKPDQSATVPAAQGGEAD